MKELNYVSRVHLKPDCKDEHNGRAELIDFCLSNPHNQYLAIGWSCVYAPGIQIQTYAQFYDAVRKWLNVENEKLSNDENKKRMNPVINLFKETEEDNLFWTRDLDGFYWICRAKGKAEAYCDKDLDIGARLPVDAYKYSMDVPGQIKASFNRANGNVSERMRDKAIVEFSKNIYNKMSKTEHYRINKNIDNNILENLPDFDLEELVISYIQIEHGYYLLSNSIAKNSTTIKVECEFRSRDRTKPGRAVVQVKGPKSEELDATDFIQYAEKGYQVFLYAPKISNFEASEDLKKNLIIVTRDDLLRFYQDYKAILPESITQWECLM